MLAQHEEAHTATVAALAQLAAAMAAVAAAGSDAKQQSTAANTVRQLVKRIAALRRQLLSGSGLRSIIKQDVLVELQRDHNSSSGGGRDGQQEEEEEDVASWALRLLREDVWRSRAQDAFGQGTK